MRLSLSLEVLWKVFVGPRVDEVDRPHNRSLIRLRAAVRIMQRLCTVLNIARVHQRRIALPNLRNRQVTAESVVVRLAAEKALQAFGEAERGS